MTTRVIKTPEQLADLFYQLAEIKLPFTNTASVGTKRTEEQNRTIHKWFGEIAAQRGDVTMNDVKAECNLEFGLPIMQRDDVEWASVFMHLFRGLDYERKLKAIRVLDIPFTRRMKVKQLNEYMDGLQRQASERGHVLTIPEGKL